MKAAATPVGTGGNPNVGPPVRLPFRFPSLPVCLPCTSHPSPTKASSKLPAPNDDTASAGLATRVALEVRGENPPSRTRVEGPQPTLSPPPNCTPLPSRISRFATPNPFSSLISDSESDSSDSESDDENETVSLTSHSLAASNLPVTSPQPFLSLLCASVLRPLVSLPAPMSALSSVSVSCSSPLIADSGCTSILIQMANFPPLSQFFTSKSLPQVPFTLPDGNTLEVGTADHLTGELTFPHKSLPGSVYFIPYSSLSHSLFGVSPLIRPHGHAVFTSTSCLFFDSPTAPLPFLQGTKAPLDDLWYLQVPSLPLPNHTPSIFFSLQELPHARFVAYWHHAFGSPSLSTFLDALSSNFIRNIPRLTAALVRKYPPLSLSTHVLRSP